MLRPRFRGLSITKRSQLNSEENQQPLTELDRIRFRGHENIMALHDRTIEITKDNNISRRADCIIGVSSSKACTELTRDAKDWIFSGRWLRFEIDTMHHSFAFEGKGSPKLELADERELVLRVSDYISRRTAAVNCTQSAHDLPRGMIKELQNPQSTAVLRLFALPLKMEKEFVWSLP